MMTQTALFLVLLSSTVFAAINKFTCDNERPMEGSNVICKCVTSNDMEWQLNDVALSQCTTTGICSPKPAGYVFETNTNNPDKEYSLTVQQYDYSSCSVYSCTDLNTTEEQQITLSVAAFNSTSPSVIVEPGSHKNGKIEITTECLFKETDIVVKWYSVDEDDEEELYTTGGRFQTSTNCTDNCNGEASVRLNIGFTHTEDEESRYTQNVKFRLKVYHKEDPTNVLDLKTSSEYKIKGIYQCYWVYESQAKEGKDGCPVVMTLISLVMVLSLPMIGLILGLILIFLKCCCGCFKKGESCKNCVSNNYCSCKCFASTPCRVCCNIRGLPHWFQGLWASIIGSPVALGIWLAWKCYKPDKPDITGSTSPNPTSIEVTWPEQKDEFSKRGFYDITHQQVTVKTSTSVDGTKEIKEKINGVKEELNKWGNEYTIENLTPGTYYEVKVYAFNGKCYSSPGRVVLQTQIAEKPGVQGQTTTTLDGTASSPML